MFIQIHMLQSMPPGNLNRDDTGQPKKCLFGGVTRARISSQCLKRNIRTSDYFEAAFGSKLAKRTKYLPHLVAQALQGIAAISPTEIEGVKAGIAAQFKKEAKKGPEDDGEGADAAGGNESSGQTPQLVFFNPIFADKIADLLVGMKKDNPKGIQQVHRREGQAIQGRGEGRGRGDLSLPQAGVQRS